MKTLINDYVVPVAVFLGAVLFVYFLISQSPELDRSTITSVAIGGFIAVLPVILTNWYQATERQKDRTEKRRELEKQLEAKLLEEDVSKVKDYIDAGLKLLRELKGVHEEVYRRLLRDEIKERIENKVNKRLSQLEIKAKMEDEEILRIADENIIRREEKEIETVNQLRIVSKEREIPQYHSELRETQSAAMGIIYSLDKKIVEAYNVFEKSLETVQKWHEFKDREKINSSTMWDDLFKRHGNLHKLLRNKLVEVWADAEMTKTAQDDK